MQTNAETEVHRRHMPGATVVGDGQGLAPGRSPGEMEEVTAAARGAGREADRGNGTDATTARAAAAPRRGCSTMATAAAAWGKVLGMILSFPSRRRGDLVLNSRSERRLVAKGAGAGLPAVSTNESLMG